MTPAHGGTSATTAEPPDSQTGLRAALGDIVGDPILVSATWYECKEIPHQPNVGTTAGLWQWRGRMSRRDGGLDWSLVQKRLALATRSERWPGEPDAHDWGYWRREADALTSPLLHDLGPRWRRPRCHAVIRTRGHGVDLWTEHLGADTSVKPDTGTLGAVARAVGEWQGRYLGGELPVPDETFLCRGFLARYRDLRGTLPAIQTAWWALPPARRHFDPALESLYDRIESAAPRLLAALEKLPRVVNHNDLWPRNIFASGPGFAGIDWAYVGAGACGEDPGNLIPDSLADAIFDPRHADTIRTAVTDGYVAGVAAAGWGGDMRALRLGIEATAALRYSWLLPTTLRRIAGGTIEDAAIRANLDVDRLLAARAAATEIALRMGESAITLCEKLGY